MRELFGVYDELQNVVILGTIASEERAAYIKGIEYMDSNVALTKYHTDDQIYTMFDTMAEKRGGNLYVDRVIVGLSQVKKPVIVETKKKVSAK